MSLGLGALGSSPLSASFGTPTVYATCFSWPMMWQGVGTPTGWVNTDAGDVVGAVDPAGQAAVLAWSDNPSLCQADFLINPTYGARKAVDWASVAVAANRCDELCGTEKRCLITLALAESQDIENWIDVLRGYIPGWVDWIGATAYIIADAPKAGVDHTFTTATGIESDASLSLVKRGIRNRPNVVEIGYMKTDVKPWAMDYVAADTSPATRRKARIDMPGIRRYSQAKRFAIERLNHYNLEAIETQIPVFEDGLKVLIGDLCDVTDDIGLAATRMRVTGRQDRGYGRWLLGLRKFDPNAYDNSVQTAPATPDTGLPNPKIVQAPTLLVLSEVVYLEKALAADSVSRGFIYQSRIEASWTASSHAYPVVYRVVLKDGTTVINEATTPSLVYASPAIQQGRTYTVEVYAQNSLGFTHVEPLSGSLVAQGKFLIPGNVPSIKSAFELGGEIYLEWEPAIDLDIDRYEWKYAAAAGFDYASATLIDRVDGLRAQFKGLPVGPWRLAVKAMDSVGNRSATETTVDLIITSDQDAFIQNREFTAPTLVNMVAFPMVEGIWKLRWATSVPGQTWNASITGTVNSVVTPVMAQHASGTQSFTGESWDLGAAVVGDWTLAAPTTVISGAVAYYIETSDNGSAWTRRPGVSWKGSARFVRPIIEALGTSTFRLEAPPAIAIAAQTKSESGEITTLASGGYLVQLGGLYVSAQDLQVTPVNTTASRNAVADRILPYPQGGLALFFTIAGAGDEYVYQNIANPARTILADDFLEYDVWIDGGAPAASTYSAGGARLHYTDTTYNAAVNDQNGYDLFQPATGMDALARGQWYSRKVALAADVGKVSDQVLVGSHSDGDGNYKLIFRNVRFTNGSGTNRQAIWTTGEPTVNTTALQNGASNVRSGPTNSFLVYAFTSSTGAQVVSDVRWNFKGF